MPLRALNRKCGSSCWRRWVSSSRRASVFGLGGPPVRRLRQLPRVPPQIRQGPDDEHDRVEADGREPGLPRGAVLRAPAPPQADEPHPGGEQHGRGDAAQDEAARDGEVPPQPLPHRLARPRQPKPQDRGGHEGGRIGQERDRDRGLGVSVERQAQDDAHGQEQGEAGEVGLPEVGKPRMPAFDNHPFPPSPCRPWPWPRLAGDQNMPAETVTCRSRFAGFVVESARFVAKRWPAIRRMGEQLSP